MECSIMEQKIQAMKNYKRAKFVCNFVLYSLTSIITCLFFSYPFWFPSMDHFLSSLPNNMNHFLSSLPNNISCFLNAKCFFVVGNLIVLILVGESKLRQSSSSSSTSDIYDEFVARSRSSHPKVLDSYKFNGSMKSLNIEEKVHHEKKKEEVRVCKSSVPHVEEKRKGMRTCKSEVWGESEIVKREKIPKGKKEEFYKGGINHEEKRKGMRTCKSEVWGESEIVKKEKTKGKKEEMIYKSSVNHEEKKIGMRSCKSEVWGESEVVKREETKGKKEEMIYNMNHEEKKIGMRSCKSEVWGESEIVKREETKGKEEEEQPYMAGEELNKRVEAFIARVNKQRLLEAKSVDHGRG